MAASAKAISAGSMRPAATWASAALNSFSYCFGFAADAGPLRAVINNASVLGWRAQKGQAHYAAAKAGVMALTRCSAVEAAEHGVRINAVSPSIALHEFLKKASSEELLAQLSSREAFGRAAEVWEVANVMVFLASDYASYMTGEVLSVSSQHA